MIESSAGAASLVVPAAQDARRSFFTWMGGVLLVIVLVGFAPTLYFRSYFHPPEVPAYLYAHGGVLTTWFVLLLLQPLLIASGQRTWHRRVGWLGALVAAAVVGVSGFTDFHFVNRLGAQIGTAAPQLSHHDTAAQVSTAVLGFAGQILVFAALVTLAVLLRNSSASHKRLMLTASIGIVGAAAARWGYVLVAIGVAPQMAFPIAGIVGTLGVPWALLAAIVVHDKRTLGRVLPITWWTTGIAALLPLLVRQLGTAEIAIAWTSRMIYGAG